MPDTANKASNRWRPSVVRRYVDIGLLTVCGCLVACAILSLRIPLPKWVDSNAQGAATGWFGFLFMTAFWSLLLSVGGLRVVFSYRRRQWRYPSVSVAVLGAALAMTLHRAYLCSQIAILDPAYGESLWLACTGMASVVLLPLAPMVALLLGVALRDVYDRCREDRGDGVALTADAGPYDPDLPDSLQWILDERPAETLGADDRFRRAPIVTRLARILGKTDKRGLIKSVGLLGPYGSGKSTITRFLEDTIAKERDDTVFVRVPGWGVAGDGLTEFVLKCAIEALEARGYDCLAIRGLPRQYLAAIGALNDKAGKLFGAACSGLQSPGETLQGLVPLLDPAGLRVVLCIEDVERSATREALQELAAMLDRFRHVPRVTFVVEANANSSEHLDLFRICDHVETVPALPATETWGYLCELRNVCVAYARKCGDVLAAEETLDTRATPPVCREDAFWSGISEVAHAFADDRQFAVKHRLAEGTGTPRALKHGLRRAWLLWQKLHGEVDLRELILLSVLRDAVPEAFEFVVRNLPELRDLTSVPTAILMGTDEQKKAARERKLTRLQERWDRAMGESVSGRDEAVFAILAALDLDFVDPYARIGRRTNAFQSIHRSDPQTNYLHRILAGAVDDGAPSDQEVLREIRQWSKGSPSQLLAKVLAGRRHAEKLAQFHSVSPGKDDKRRMCDEYFALALDRYGVQAGEELPGFPLIRELASTVVRIDGVDGEWLKAKIDQAFDVSLRLVSALYSLTREVGGDRSPFRRHVAEELIKRTAGDSDYLGRVLDPGYSHTLYQLIRLRGDFPVFNTPEEWRDGFAGIVASVEAAPLDVMSNFVPLFIRDVRASEPGGERPYQFDVDYAGRLIPDRESRQRLIDVLFDYADRSDAEPEVARSIRDVGDRLRAFARMEIGIPEEPGSEGTDSEPVPGAEEEPGVAEPSEDE